MEVLLRVDLMKAKNGKYQGPLQLRALQGELNPTTAQATRVTGQPLQTFSVSLQTFFQVWDSCPWCVAEWREMKTWVLC